jgi:hypothetical protein
MVAVSLGLTMSAAAQQNPTGGPFTGLFAGTSKDQPHMLDVRGSAFTAWDDNVLATAPGASGAIGYPGLVQPGIASGFNASVVYGYRTSGTRSSFRLNADGSVQEYASSAGTGTISFQSYNVGASLRERLTPKIASTFGIVASYAPFYQYVPILKSTGNEDSPVGADYGFAVESQFVRSTTASASLEDRLSKRSSLVGGVSWAQQVLPSEDLTTEIRGASLTFNHGITRKLNFYVGYGVQQTFYHQPNTTLAPYTSNAMTIGLGYGDGLTIKFARHYTLSLSASASVLKNGDVKSVATTGQNTAFVVNGAAVLSRSIGRTWSATLAYTRGVNYAVGFPVPYNMDAATAGIGGPVVGRLYFSAGAGASRGQQVFSAPGAGTMVAYSGSARLMYGIFKNLGLYGQASYYKYSIPDPIQVFGFLPQLDRRTVMVGVTAWLPLIKPPRVTQTAQDLIRAGQL